jgi:urease
LSEISVFIHLHISSQTLIKVLCISLVWPWVWQAALEAGVKSSYGLDKRVEAIGHVRKISKLDMKLNSAMPMIEVDPETYHVTADGFPLVCQAAESLPLTQNYFLF